MNLKPLALSINQFAGGGNVFGPAALFTGGEQGLWYDLNDDSTVFQDSAGTTLATWGDPVGRVNDKSGNGNDALQSTSGARPIRGRMPKRGRVNLLTNSGAFTAWTKGAGLPNITLDAGIESPVADASVYKISEGTVNNNQFIQSNTISVSGTSVIRVVARDAAQLRYMGIAGMGIAGAGEMPVFDLANGTVDKGETTTIVTDATINHLTDGWYECLTYLTGSITNFVVIAVCNSATDNTVTNYQRAGNGTSGFYITTSQAELGATATAYQHVIDSLGYNITESGQPSCGYLSFNGSNQWMQTAASVNFSATDEMSVFAGVRKVSDAAAAILIELSADFNTNAGSFNSTAPAGATPSFSATSRGTAAAAGAQQALINSAPYAAPIFAVKSDIHDISGDSTNLRINGVSVNTSAGDKGAGNFGNYVTYFGARAGTSIYFNGLMFSTIIRGALTSGTLLTRTEQYVARQTPTVNL